MKIGKKIKDQHLKHKANQDRVKMMKQSELDKP